MLHLDDFTQGCLDALEFTDMGPGDECEDAELSDQLKARLEADCHSFWARCWFLVVNTDMTPAQAGHDFWLTRNGHGAGFWDGDWDHTPYADTLDKLASSYGSLDVILGDDGKVYG